MKDGFNRANLYPTRVLGAYYPMVLNDNTMFFSWENPKNKISFGYKTKIKTNNNIVRIKDKVKFPILDLSEELKLFIEPAEIIDSDDEDVCNPFRKQLDANNLPYWDVKKWRYNGPSIRLICANPC